MKNVYRENLRNWLDRGDWSDWFAVTLTMRQTIVSDSGEKVFIDADQAGRNLRHFLNKLNVKTYGNAFKRYNKRLEVIPTYEYADGKHLHYHLVIKKPQRLTDRRFDSLIRTNWISTDWGLWSIDIKRVSDSGWLEYVTKDTSVDFENVDIGNLWLS